MKELTEIEMYEIDGGGWLSDAVQKVGDFAKKTVTNTIARNPIVTGITIGNKLANWVECGSTTSCRVY